METQSLAYERNQFKFKFGILFEERRQANDRGAEKNNSSQRLYRPPLHARVIFSDRTLSAQFLIRGPSTNGGCLIESPWR
jgi:hypothetical protein